MSKIKCEKVVKNELTKESRAIVRKVANDFYLALQAFIQESRNVIEYGKTVLALCDDKINDDNCHMIDHLLTKMWKLSKQRNEMVRKYGEAYDYYGAYVGQEYLWNILDKMENSAISNYEAAIKLTNSIVRNWHNNDDGATTPELTNGFDRTFKDNLEDQPLVE